MGIMKKLSYQVLEDNGGGLYLAIFDDNDNCIHFSGDYEYCQGALKGTLDDLKSGAADISSLEGAVENPAEVYEDMIRHLGQGGTKIVADENGIYPDKMGYNASAEFGVNEK